MEYYVKTICTKTHFFVQQHYLVTVMISSMIHLNKRKKITRCFKVRYNWYTQFHRLDSHLNRFFPTFITQVLAEVSYFVVCISWSFHGCVSVAKDSHGNTMKIQTAKRWDSAGRVYFCQILRTRYTRTRVICHAFLLSLCNVLFVKWTFDLIDWHLKHTWSVQFREKEHSSTARKDST